MLFDKSAVAHAHAKKTPVGKPRVIDLLMYAERRECDNSDCNWGVELDGIWDSKRIETNGLNHVKLFLVLLKCNTLIKNNYGGYGILGTLSLFLFLLFPLLPLPSKSQG